MSEKKIKLSEYLLKINYYLCDKDNYIVMKRTEKVLLIYTGGTIFNVRLAKNEYDAKGIAVLLERIMENYTIPYITLNTCNRDYPIEGYLYQEAVNER